MGAIAGKASQEELNNLRSVGELFGLAYQIADDLIDNFEGTGKTKGKDLSAHKLTYLTFMSPEEARNKISSLIEEAKLLLRSFGSRAQPLYDQKTGASLVLNTHCVALGVGRGQAVKTSLREGMQTPS